jgi:ABC-type branched-subunit amino acid transport system permease subunit
MGALPRAALVGSAILVVAPVVVPSWVLFILTLALGKFMAVLGVALFLRAGMVTFGHALYYAVGAYVVGFGAKYFDFREALVLVPLGAIGGLIAAALIGLVMARYRGVFFAMLNLAFSMILYAALLKLYWLTGGTDGIGTGVPSFAGVTLHGTPYRVTYYYFTLAIAGLAIWVVFRFLASPLGYFVKAIADNEIRIEYSGESVRRVVYTTYVLSGALVAFLVGHIVPEFSFWVQSGDFVFIALLGGFESVPGPLIGAIAFEFIRTYASKYFPLAWQMTLGVIMLVIILYRPGGLWAIYESIAARLGGHARKTASA